MLKTTTSKVIFRLAIVCSLALSCAVVSFAQPEQPISPSTPQHEHK